MYVPSFLSTYLCLHILNVTVIDEMSDNVPGLNYLKMYYHLPNRRQIRCVNMCLPWGAAIAQWICLHLKSCRPGFKPQAHHLCFYRL